MIRRSLFFFGIILLASFMCNNIQAADSGTKKHILLINSYHKLMPWVEDIVQGTVDVLQPKQNNINLHVENMDSKEFNTPEYFDSFLGYIKVKYKETPLTLLLVSDNNAYDFIRENRDILFPGVPVVFCGVNNFQKSQLNGLTDFTGAAEVFSARKTIELALELQPDVKRVYIVNDYLKTGRFWAKDIDKDLEPLKQKITVEHSANLEIDELLSTVSQFTPETIVLLGAYFSDKNKEFFTYERIAALLSKNSSVPVYSLVEFVIDEGLVGGQVISGYYQGQAMGNIALEILKGKAASSIPVQIKGSNKPILNFQQLSRFGLKESSLTTNAVIINRPYSLYREYKRQVWFVAAFIVCLLFTIVSLIFNIRSRRKTEQRLKNSEKQFRQLANATWEAIVIHEDGVLLESNRLFSEMFGYDFDKLKGKQILPLVFTEDFTGYVKERLDSNDLNLYEAVAKHKDGTTFPIEVRIRKMEYEGRRVRVAAIRDLTKRKQMEEQLTQSQKMEAIGTLAGGIAHDFNNILSAIIGFSEISLLTTPDDSHVKHNLQQILNAGNRAKLLVEQILTFARRSDEDKSPVQVSRIITEALKLIQASMPSSIEIREEIETDACVLSNPTKIHQVVMNLCTNAGKAMPDGGVLSISLDEVVLEKQFVMQHSDEFFKEYLHMRVHDIGVGIPLAFQKSIFDPFFTTNSKESGTGLGLSVVHGIVAECGGFITVQSTENTGTTFNIYLPVTEQDESSYLIERGDLPRGSEQILLVDDEASLVNVGEKTLGALGYQIEGFTDSSKALNVFSNFPEKFDMVITDMTMPKMNGDKLAKQILSIRSDIPIIICTGFSEKFSREDAMELGVKRFIMKPVDMSKLAQTVRDVLDGKENDLLSRRA